MSLSYISDLLIEHNVTRPLRSRGENKLQAPRLWDDLPIFIRMASSVAILKSICSIRLFILVKALFILVLCLYCMSCITVLLFIKSHYTVFAHPIGFAHLICFALFIFNFLYCTFYSLFLFFTYIYIYIYIYIYMYIYTYMLLCCVTFI